MKLTVSRYTVNISVHHKFNDINQYVLYSLIKTDAKNHGCLIAITVKLLR